MIDRDTGEYRVPVLSVHLDDFRALQRAAALTQTNLNSYFIQAAIDATTSPHRVALVRADARFERGIAIERPDESGGGQHVA